MLFGHTIETSKCFTTFYVMHTMKCDDNDHNVDNPLIIISLLPWSMHIIIYTHLHSN